MCKAFDDMQRVWELKGERRGEDSMGKLWQMLFPAGRYEDLMLASTDRNYRKKLMKEVGII